MDERDWVEANHVFLSERKIFAMMEVQKQNNQRKTVTTTIGIIGLMILTSIATFLITVHVYPKIGCGNVELGQLTFPKENPEWTEVDRLEIKEKGVIISRPTGADRCYILPSRRTGEDRDQPRPLIILNEPLSADMLDHLAGPNGVAFCNGYTPFLAREMKMEEREKRDAPAPGPGPGPAPAPGADIFGSSQDQGKPATDVPLDQREPRCSEVLLDCVDHVGQVQSCYTWVNGAMWMDRKCTDSKQFNVHMTKPPGRILKIAQQQWIICLQRRNQGLSC